jgi:hypothetical protein
MALVTAPLLCPFTVVSDIFMLKKDTTKTHCINAKLNVLDNAPLAVYQVALIGNWLVMGLKTNSSPVDVRLSKMEATIKNITSFATASNLVVKQIHGTRGDCDYYSQGYAYERAQVDHGDGQEHATGGQLGCGDLS